MYFDVSSYYENNFPTILEQNEHGSRVELPQSTQQLKYDEADMADGRKQRKNSGCSMNFLNSFINMGFVSEGQNMREAAQEPDPYYQSIMKGCKLGLHDMYLCDNANATLETITEVDSQNYLAQGLMDGPLSEVPWNSYAGQLPSQFSFHDPTVDVNFDYLNYVNGPNNDLLFHEDL